MSVLVLVIILATLLLIRVPVAVALTLSAGIGIAAEGISLLSVAQRFYSGTVSWLLTAIPFFVLAGVIMTQGGLSRRIVAFANALVGFLPGGLAAVNIVASMFFGGISGSAVADTSAIGSVLIPEMESQGYSRKYAAAVTVASSPIGMIIPPSIPFVVWTFVSGESLSRMFLGGVLPGILVGVSLILLSTALCIRKKFQPMVRRMDFQALRSTFKDGLIALAAPAIIIGGILTGAFTATESAIIAVLYAWIVTQFVYGDFRFSQWPEVLLKAGKTSASVMFIIAGATVFSWLLALNRVPQAAGMFIVELVNTPGQFVLLGSVLLLILGMFLDTSTVILLVGPILAPIVSSLGPDPVLIAIIFMVVLAAGLFTPPLGLCLFVASSVADVRLEDIAVESIPFLLLMLGVAASLWFMPFLVTWLPGVL